MPETLTAAQLHALVNADYTMPDGSKRRALWARVPDTQPDTGALALVVLPAPPQMCACRFPGDKLCLARHQSERIAAAALIRVALQDWIWAQPKSYSNITASAVSVDTGRPIMDDNAVRWFKGETHLHALVAAAHAIADALGVPH